MKAIGIVFLYDRVMGSPDVVAKEFSQYFPSITEDLMNSKVLDLAELKDIMDSNKIYWGGIKEDFKSFLKDEPSIGGIAINVFEQNSNLEVSDEIKTLIYNGEKAPWKFDIVVCVLYK